MKNLSPKTKMIGYQIKNLQINRTIIIDSKLKHLTES